MKIFGIDFLPLNLPLKDRLEVLAAGFWYVLFMGLMPVGLATTIYLLFFTKLWPLVVAYLIWIWVIDRGVGEVGGRPSDWVRSWALHKYVVNYFPVTVKTVPGFQVDANRNYLNCAFPHGYLPIGMMSAFCTYGSAEAQAIFPHHSIYGATLEDNFLLPITRDYLLALGTVSASQKGLGYLLNYPGGGKIIGLFVGGVSEAFLCKKNEYRLVLKERKGFAKIALQHGSHIIPTFSFGQNSTFNLVMFPEGSLVDRLQKFIRRVTGLAFPVLYGRGLFQTTFGCLPLKKPINIVLGTPIEVPKIEQPSKEDIDSIHQKLIDSIVDIFNKYKHEYEESPDECQLIVM